VVEVEANITLVVVLMGLLQVTEPLVSVEELQEDPKALEVLQSVLQAVVADSQVMEVTLPLIQLQQGFPSWMEAAEGIIILTRSEDLEVAAAVVAEHLLAEEEAIPAVVAVAIILVAAVAVLTMLVQTRTIHPASKPGMVR
jgi:hypothetical protein